MIDHIQQEGQPQVGTSDLARLCDWCKLEERDVPSANPPRTHINGKYEEEHLCDECADWLENDKVTIQEWGDGFVPIREVKPNV